MKEWLEVQTDEDGGLVLLQGRGDTAPTLINAVVEEVGVVLLQRRGDTAPIIVYALIGVARSCNIYT